ncbi:MAG: hypothetical protein RIR76_222 [Verrucomicrobiota bacterium]
MDLQPDAPRCWRHLAEALLGASRFPDALTAARRALELDPADHAAWRTRGLAEWQEGRIEAARDSFQRAAHLNRNPAEDWTKVAIATLLQGDFSLGWELHEWRWLTPQHAPQRRDTRAPPWSGREPLAGKTLFVHAEQGLGDTLQFCRYLPLLPSAGGRVVLEAPEPLLPLLRTLRGVDELRPAEILPPPPCPTCGPIRSAWPLGTVCSGPAHDRASTSPGAATPPT